MRCTQEGCDAPAEYRYAWPWGQTGACCTEHVGHVKSHAQQLNREITLQPVPVQKDELAQACGKIRDLSLELRKRLEAGAIDDPGTSSLGEELQRRIRNAPAPFGDTLIAIREVGSTLIGHAMGDLAIAQQRERDAQAQVRELQRLLGLAEAATAKAIEDGVEHAARLRTQLDKAQAQILELEKQLDEPPPSTTPPPPPPGDVGDVFRVEGDLAGPAVREAPLGDK